MTPIHSLVAVSILAPALLPAQVTGRTVDRGQPLAGAQVELWTPTSRLAQRVTNSRGEFRFTAPEAVLAVAIAIRRIGYAPTRVALEPERTDYVIELSALAAPLPEVSTREAARLCPNVESAEARMLWEAATRRYLPWQADTMGRRSGYLQFMGHVHAESLGTFDPSRLRRGDGLAVTGVIQGGRQRIRSQGYVRLLSFPHHEPDYGIWGYSSLWSWYTGHFAEPAFTERHSLSVLHGDGREVTLIVCPRSRRETGMEGTVRLGRDTTFIAARWTYWNPDRNRESAGGEVVFTPPGVSARGQRLPLLPLSGLFSRKLLNGRYWQRWEEYDRWILSPTGQREPGADSARSEPKPPPNE
jgi:hypothetical protein